MAGNFVKVWATVCQLDTSDRYEHSMMNKAVSSFGSDATTGEFAMQNPYPSYASEHSVYQTHPGSVSADNHTFNDK